MQGNGIVEMNGGTGEISKFFCAKLMQYVNQEHDATSADMAYLWQLRFGQAERGKCYYADKCSIYKRSVEKRSGSYQLSLF